MDATELALCATADGRPFVAAVTGAAGELLLYSNADGSSQRIAMGAREPQLVCGADGVVHLAWRQDLGLSYATSSDWVQAAFIAAPSLRAWVSAALDASGQPYIAWAAEGGVWAASGVDWQSQWLVTSTDVPVEGLTLAVSATGEPHLLLWGQQTDGVPRLYYVHEARAPAQLRVEALGAQHLL